jgi:class 3 adenylate cyclase
MADCAHCGETNPPQARFCLACGQPLTDAAKADIIRRNVSIVFADLVGSTALGESLDGEALRYVTGRYFEAMRTAVESHGGTVEKFIGDAVVALFGVPRVREDDALRAVRAAEGMRAALGPLNIELMRDLAVSLQIRVGVNTGSVIIGESRAGGSVATGDAVNVAARLEQAAGPDEILIGDGTYRLVRHAVSVEAVPPLELKGKAAPAAAWRLIDVADVTESARTPAFGSFVGRDAQLRLLEDAYERVEGENSCLLVTVLGLAGMGKSRLAAEFISRVPEATVLTGRCLSYGQGATYWPLRDVVLDSAHLTGEESADVAAAAMAAVLGAGVDTTNVVQRLLSVAGYNREEPVPDDVPWAVRTLLERIAADRPVLLVVDDLHWAEAGLLDVLEHIADWSRDSPIMVVGLARPEFYDTRPSWGGGKLNATAVLLSALDDAATISLIEKQDLPGVIAQRIAETAGGNPLFVEQLLAMLVDDGHITVDDGVHRWVGGPPESISLAMPPTVSALLAARIDRLTDDERAVLSCASVVGTVFYLDPIAELLSRTPTDVKRLLGQLVRKELLRPTTSDLAGQTAYRFLHVLVRDAAYDGLTKSARAQWHEGVADWLSALDIEAVPEEVVGHHLVAAWDCRRQIGPETDQTRALARRAAHLLGAAGIRYALSDVAAAAALLKQAAELTDAADPQRYEWLLSLASAQLQIGQIDESLSSLEIVRDEGSEQQSLLALVLLCRSNNTLTQESRQDDIDLVDLAISRFSENGDDRGLAHAFLVRADLDLFGMHNSRAAESLALAIQHAERAGDLSCLASARTLLTIVFLFGPTPAEAAIEQLDQMVTESGNNPRVRAEVEQVTCVMHAMRGRFDIARAIATQARQHLTEVGQGLFLANLAQSTGHVEELAGDLDAAEREYAWSSRELDAIGERAYLSTVAGMHARLLASRGKWEAASGPLAVARSSGSPDDASTQSLIYETEALLAAAANQPDVARAAIAQALSFVSATQAPDDAAQCFAVAAKVERLLGDTAAERGHLERAQALFERRGNIVSSRQMAEYLAAMP